MSTQPPPNQGQPNTTGDAKAAPPAPDPKLADLQKKVEALEKNLAKEAATRRVRVFSFWSIAVVLVILWLLTWLKFNCGWWSHLLLVVAILAAVMELWTRLRKSKNIDASDEGIPKWDPAKPDASLAEIHLYVLQQAARSIEWYWKNKGSKAFWSQVIRFLVWALAAIGGLLPIIGGISEKSTFLPKLGLNLTNGLWASLLLGIAAALIGLDKGFGFSSGWARYVLTATNIRKTLEEFRLDWPALRAKAGDLTADTAAPLIERARQFRSDIEALVLQETKDWVTEFQSTMAQMEKDISSQISSLKAQVDKTLKEKQDAATPGFVQLTITDPANKFAKASLKATLLDSSNQPVTIAKDLPVTSLIWTSPFVPPGLYHLKIEGTVDSTPFSQTRDATVKPGDKAVPGAPDITL